LEGIPENPVSQAGWVLYPQELRRLRFRRYPFSFRHGPGGFEKLRFIEEKRNLILFGNVGTGKTYLATALGVEACRKGHVVRFYRTSALVNQLMEAKKGGTRQKFLKGLEKADLIICDEWGYVPLERDGSRLLFQVVSGGFYSCYKHC